MLNIEKRIILKNGQPDEIRYYEEDVLVARLGVKLDADGRAIGLFELPVEEVVPQSWLWKIKRLGKPRIDITTVDFIGLINWIDTINTINNINNIKSIGNANFQNNIIKNGAFGTGDLSSWRTDTEVGNIHEVVNNRSFVGDHSFHGIRTTVPFRIYQDLPPIYGDELRMGLWMLGTATKAIYLYIEYTDGTSDTVLHTFAASNVWEFDFLAPTTHKLVKNIYIQPNTDQEFWVGLVQGARAERRLTTTDELTATLNSSSMKTLRWSVPREPTWEHGSETTAPAALSTLVSKTVTVAMTGRVFGVHITADEGNQFQLILGAAVKMRFALGAAGTIHIVLALPLVDSITAGTIVTLKNVTAGAALKVYQASLLYDEA